MKLIVAMSMLATALLGTDIQMDSANTTTTTVLSPTTTTIVSEAARSRSEATTTTVNTTNRAELTLPLVPVSSVRIVPGIDDAEYPEWWLVALDVGWPTELLATLDEVIYRESRGQPDVVGTGAYGLTQIQYNAHESWLTVTREELFDPAINLRVAYELYQIAEEMYGCGWQPWYMSGEWC